MNKIEVLKSIKGGLEIKDDIDRMALEGWESISDDDIQRLKWYGLFLRNPTPGFFMLRIRIPNGISYSHQIKTISFIAGKFGNGVIDITTRQQVQLRQLKIENVPEIFSLLEEAGLTSCQTGLDNVRNIMGCPVAGLTPREKVDGFSLVKALNDQIVGDPVYSNLPRKFNIAISGCPDDCVHAETQDLALVPAVQEKGGKKIYGFNVLAGGKLGSGGYRIASSLDIFLEPDEVVDVCIQIILIYRDHGSREARNKNRLAFLLEDWGEEKFRAEIEKRLGKSLTVAGVDIRGTEKSDHIGVYRQKQPLMNYVGLKIPVGRIQSSKLEEIGRLAEKYGTGEIRFTHANSLVIPNVHDNKIGEMVEEESIKEFTYFPSSVMRGLVACVGSDYCNLAAIETKSQAIKIASQLEGKLTNTAPITMHWSGCPAGCGNHLVADVGLLGKKMKRGKEVVEAVDIYMGGRSGTHAKLATKVMEDVPCDQLAKVLEQIIPYHTRQKMHPIKGKKYSKNWKQSPTPSPLKQSQTQTEAGTIEAKSSV
ncbi:MAG: ferredoxin--nitrite reductase [Nitrospinales bacterium]